MKTINLLLISALSFLMACLPQTQKASCGSNEAFDTTTRSCVPTVGSNQSGLVTISSVAPSTSYSRSVSSSTAVNHTVSIVDPYNTGYTVKWFRISGATSTQVAANTLSYNVIPSAIGIGTHVIEVIVYDTSGQTPLDSRSWSVVITSQSLPAIDDTLNSPGTATFTQTTADSAFNFSVTVNNPDNISGSLIEWSINGVAQVPTTSVSSVASSTSSSFSFDPSAQGSGTYVVQATVRTATTTYDTNSWTVVVQAPNLPVINPVTDPATSSTVTAIDGQTLASGNFTVSGSPVNFCLSVNDADGTDDSSGVYVQFYDNGSPIGGQNFFAGDNVDTCLATVLPAYSYTLPDSSVGEFRTFTARVFDVATGLQSGDSSSPISWSVYYRPENTAPETYIANPTVECTTVGSEPTTASNCTLTQDDSSVTFELVVEDDDYAAPTGANINNFQVNFYLNGQLLDGNHPYSPSTCERAYAYSGVDKYQCDLEISSYIRTGGSQQSDFTQSFTLTAIVEDDGSSFTATTEQSNTLTWNITAVNEAQTSPTISPQGASNLTDSYIASNGTPTTPTTGPLAEDSTIVFSILNNDSERDDYLRKFQFCGIDAACNTSHPTLCGSGNTDISPLTLINVTGASDATHRSTFFYTLPQNTITGAASGFAHFLVTITDQPDSAAGVPATEIVCLEVTNNNPAPVIAGTPDPLTTDTIHVMTGFPVTFNPGTISDASTDDGNTIEYQWQVQENGAGAWTDLPNGTSSTLVWTPSNDYSTSFAQQQVSIRLCVGDDGFGNDVATCATNIQWDDIYVHPNIINLASEPFDNGASLATLSTQEVATWTQSDGADSEKRTVYTAYTEGTNIIIEKTVYNSDGVADNSEFKAIAFPTVSTAGPNTSARDLSIVGTETGTSLYVAYIAEDSVTSQSLLRVRRIDMDQDAATIGSKASFSDLRKFGFVYDGIGVVLSGADDSFSTDGTTGEVTISFDTDQSASGNVTIVSNSAPPYTLNSLLISTGSDFCNPSCGSGDIAATDFAAYFNGVASTATESLFQGITAQDNLNDTVTLKGMNLDEVFDGTNIAIAAGKIVIANNNRWYLPFIDASQPVADLAKVNVISGPVDSHLGSSVVNTANVLTSTQASYALDNDINFDGSELIVATIANGGQANVHRFELSGNNWTNAAGTASQLDIFSGEDLLNIQVAASNNASNTNHFVVAQKDNATSDFMASRLSADFSSINTNTDANTLLISEAKDVTAYDIVMNTSGDGAFLGVITSAAHSDGANYQSNAYLLELTDATPYLQCNNNNDCVKINPDNNATLSQDVIAAEVALSRPKIDFNVGQEGATANENIKDVAAMVYMIDDGGGTNYVQQAIINIEAEAIQSTSRVDTEEYYNPPYVAQ